MHRNQRLAGKTLWLAALLTSLFFVSTARAQGQLPAYKGKFTLPYEVHWGRSVLRPGDYTFTIQDMRSPIIALVRTAEGNAVTYVESGSLSGHTNGVNALLIRERDGQLIVHSLALADLGVLLIYDPSLAQEPTKVAPVKRSVPILAARK